MNAVSIARRFAFVVVALFAIASHSPAWGVAPNATTVVSVKKLCPTCGKKIVRKLEQLPQRRSASINVEQKIVQVVAKPGQSLSPRLVWETIEKGGEQPVKLQSPTGIFTSKPQK